MEIWVPLLLFAVGFVALFLELFVPAAGAIGAVGFACMVAATVLAYRSMGKGVGALFLAGILVGTPAMVTLGLKVFPKTFVGRKLILHQSMDRQAGFTSSDAEAYGALLGREGVALTTLRPSGMARIDGGRYSVVTGGEMVERGEAVRVTKVEGNRIVVRKTT